ncbi:phage tail tape measure protein, partial [Streptococcus suis]
SIEEVTENLQSFLKGNYENDAALGISATETTRNTAANKLYGKSFNELSEAQKQLTLLQMVEDGNELSGALGQAARESDGLENVLGNLRQSGTNALAAIGQPILEMLIPVFQSLADIVSQLATWFTNLSSPIKEVVIIFTGILAVVGMLLPVFLGLQV